MLLSIEKIKVADRIRKDFGNIEELANDIKENSLLNPITVIPIENGYFQLLAGERRLRACKQLGMQDIIVNTVSVKDAEQALRIEIAENENRKEFTFSERMEWSKRLEEIERIKAKERQSGLNGKNQLVQSFAEAELGKTRDKVAEIVGIGSGEQYRKAKFIAENASDEIVEALDKGSLSINSAYQQLKNEKEEAERRIAWVEQANELHKENLVAAQRALEKEKEKYEKEKAARIELEQRISFTENKPEFQESAKLPDAEPQKIIFTEEQEREYKEYCEYVDYCKKVSNNFRDTILDVKRLEVTEKSLNAWLETDFHAFPDIFSIEDIVKDLEIGIKKLETMRNFLKDSNRLKLIKK